MTLFDPMRDFFQRRQVARLDALSSGLQLVTLRSESLRGNFVFPGQDITAAIEQHGQRVGHISYGISPLQDRLYISDYKIRDSFRRQGLGQAALWRLNRQHGMSLATLHEVGSSLGFWSKVERRFAGAGVHLQRDIRIGDQAAEQQRWQHLVPEPEHERLIRELMASPEWPAIKARLDAENGPFHQV